MREKATWVLSVMLVATMLATVVGCASTETTPSLEPTKAATEAPAEEQAEATQEPAEEPAKEPVRIGVYSLAWSAPQQEMMAELIEKFNVEHKGEVEAEYIQGDWGEVDTYMTGGIAGSGGIADVVEYYVGGAQEWYEQGFLRDLSPYVTDEIRSTMPEVLWDARTAEDGTLFMSGMTTGDHTLIYYNPKLFEEAGIDPPAPDETWTWEEFLTNAKLLTVDANGKHLGEDGYDPDNVVQWGFLPRLDNEKLWEKASVFSMQASGEPMIRKDGDGNWDIFFDEEAMPALRVFFGLIQEGITPEMAVGLTGDSQDEAFAQGMAAMVLRAYFNIGVLQSRYPDFEFSVMPIPMEPGSKYYVGTEGAGWTVPVTSEEPDAAAEWAFWFQEKEPQAMWASGVFVAPCNPEALEHPILRDDPDFDALRFYKSIEEVVAVPHNKNQDEFITTLYAPTMMEVVQGNLTLEEGIEQIKADSQSILNQGY